MKPPLQRECYCSVHLKHLFRLCLIHPVYSLHDSCGESNYFQLSSTLLLVTLRLLFISLTLPRPPAFQSVRQVAFTDFLPVCVGNSWVNSSQSVQLLLSLLLDYQLLFQDSSAQMSFEINEALSAKLIRSGMALLLLIKDFIYIYIYMSTFNVKQKHNHVKLVLYSHIFSAAPTPTDVN